MIAELLLALELLDGVKQRDGMTPSGTPTKQKPQEKFVKGLKEFIKGIKNPFKR